METSGREPAYMRTLLGLRHLMLHYGDFEAGLFSAVVTTFAVDLQQQLAGRHDLTDTHFALWPSQTLTSQASRAITH